MLNFTPEHNQSIAQQSSITESETKLLSLGLKYSMSPLRTDNLKERITADLVCSITAPPADFVRQISSILKSPAEMKTDRAQTLAVRSLRKKVDSAHLLITKANKGNKAVVMS